MLHRGIVIDGRLLAYRRGGIARYVASLAAALPVVAPDLRYSLLINRGIADVPLSTVRVVTPPHNRLERSALGLELRLRRPTLIHSPDFIAPRAGSIPTVATVHDLAFLDRPELLDRDSRRYYGQIRSAIQHTHRVIAVSETTREKIIERLRYPAERVRTIYNGVDERFFVGHRCEFEFDGKPYATAPDRELPADRPILLTVGSVEPRKRQQVLGEAIGLVARRHPSLAPFLVVVGQAGWMSSDIQAAIERMEAAGQATWLRDVSDEELACLYRRATMLALASSDEGFGLPAAEAMASGTPVVVAKRGALPEIVGDAGVLVDDDAAESWAGAIERVLDDQTLRNTLSARGRKRATRFRWSHAAAQTAALYREVLER